MNEKLPEDEIKKPKKLELALIWNILTLIVVTITCLLFYNNHLYTELNRNVTAFGTVGILTILRLIPWLIDKSDKKLNKNIINNIMVSGKTSWVFMIIFIVVFLANMMVSSLYLVYDDNSADNPEFLVTMKRESAPFYMDSISVKELTKREGKRILHWFYPWNSEGDGANLTVMRDLLPLYEPYNLHLKSGSVVKLNIPDDLTKKKLHLVCIVPSDKLFNRLPVVNDTSGRQYTLSISGETVFDTKMNLFKQIVFTGTESPLIPYAINKIELNEIVNDAARGLIKKLPPQVIETNPNKKNDIKENIKMMLEEPYMLGCSGYEIGDKISIVLTSKLPNQEPRIENSETLLIKNKDIHYVFLGN